MKCYIVTKDDEMKIIKVKAEDEAGFLEQYKGCILAEGSSVQELIMKFSKWMNEQSGE